MRLLAALFFSMLLILLPFEMKANAAFPTAASGLREAHILILHSYHPSFIWTREMETGIMTELHDASVPIHVSVEFLDQKNFPEANIQELILHSIAEKYQHEPVDIVITTDNYATEQAIKLKKALFPQASIVFCGYNGYRDGQFAESDQVSGVIEPLDVTGTVDLAKTLFPETNRVVVLHDDTESGIAALEEVRSAEAKWRDRIKFEYWGKRSYAEWLRDVKLLPSGTIVLFGVLTRDRLVNVIEMREFAQDVSEAADVPLFQLYKMNYGTGAMGGSLVNGALQGQKAAEIALQILSGEQPDMSVVVPSAGEKHLDFRQMERFHIPLSRAPDDVTVDYRPIGFYEAYLTMVWAVVIVISGLLAVIYILFLNIHRRKRAELAMRRMNDELELRVKNRTRDLAAANQELESFSYSVSHDLRAPLRSIDGFSQILIEDYETVLDKTGKDYLARVRLASEKMAGLIDDILRLSRVSRCEIEKTTVDLSAMAAEVVGELLDEQPQRSVVCDFTPELVCQADRQLLRIALVNLFGNALKYSSHRQETRLQFGALTQDGETVYFIRENGAGFDMAYADKLFGAFQRLHTNAEFSGSGIGLAIVERIIRKHGGRIWAEAATGEGATFFFTL